MDIGAFVSIFCPCTFGTRLNRKRRMKRPQCMCACVCFPASSEEQEETIRLANQSTGIIFGTALVVTNHLVHIKNNVLRIFLDTPNFK